MSESASGMSWPDEPTARQATPQPHSRRIIVLRLDRIGDVVLSTPVLAALREAYPDSFLAMLVRAACREVVEGHPALNEVIVYDKEGAHRGVLATIRFALALRRYRFDTAVVLHPTNRSHWIPWLAGIPTRIGYDRKVSRLLTHRVPHRKHEGTKHEAAYALEMLETLGITGAAPAPVIRVRADAAARVESLLGTEGLRASDRLVAIHPSASCVSKRWMPERFAQVADRLIQAHGVRICLIAGNDDVVPADQVARAMRGPVVNLAGRLSLAELAAFLARCRVLLSNDSGPVHVAAAVGVPVAVIFGRNQRGLSPERWGPVGTGHVVLHKEVGCPVCLAHNCQIAFLCLTELSVDEVYRAASDLLERTQAVA